MPRNVKSEDKILKNKLINIISLLAVALMSSPSQASSSGGGEERNNILWAQDGTRDALLQRSENYFWGSKGRMTVVSPSSGVRVAATQASSLDMDSLYKQFNYVFGGVPGEEYDLAGGQRLLSGCEPHNCVGNKAFAVTDPTGDSIIAAGFFGVRCGADRESKSAEDKRGCDSIPTLTIFYQDKSARESNISIGIVKWAREITRADGHYTKFKIEEKFIR